MELIYDVLVVGLGGSGSASLYHLSKSNLKVIGIEQYKFSHHNGSSHGDTRITRHAYFEGESYIPFVRRATELWHQLELDSKKKLFHKTGLLNISDINDKNSIYHSCLKAVNNFNISYEDLDYDEINKRYNFFNLKNKDYKAIHELEAGILFPEECVKTHLEMALKNKAVVISEAEVTSIIKDINSGTYKVQYLENKINKIEIQVKKIVLTCGPWLNKLLKNNFDYLIPLTIDVNYVFYFKFKDHIKVDKTFPIYIIEDDGKSLYGFPDIDNGNSFKVSFYKQDNIFKDYNSVNRNNLDFNKLQLYKACEKHINNFKEDNIELVKVITCLYSTTPDRDFVIDYLPNSNQDILIVSACSGHGFKFTSAIGEHASNLIQGSGEPFKDFKIDRFNNFFKSKF